MPESGSGEMRGLEGSIFHGPRGCSPESCGAVKISDPSSILAILRNRASIDPPLTCPRAQRYRQNPLLDSGHDAPQSTVRTRSKPKPIGPDSGTGPAGKLCRLGPLFEGGVAWAKGQQVRARDSEATIASTGWGLAFFICWFCSGQQAAIIGFSGLNPVGLTAKLFERREV